MAATAVTTAAGAAVEHASGGLPQFDPSWWPGQMVWMLVIFGVMFFLFAKVFVPRVGGIIAEREDRISGDIGEARRLRDVANAEAVEAAAETAQARAHAQRLVLEAKAKSQAEAAAHEALEQARVGETIAKAEASIIAVRDQAMTHVSAIAAETAGLIVAKLTGAPPNAAELRAAASSQA
jgi:F-type H+-transporting ATPase subunit b